MVIVAEIEVAVSLKILVEISSGSAALETSRLDSMSKILSLEQKSESSLWRGGSLGKSSLDKGRNEKLKFFTN